MASPDLRLETPSPEFAELKFAKDKGPTYNQKLDAFQEPYVKKGKSYGSIAANNVVSLVSGIAELGEHYSIPLFKPFAAKLAKMDIDPKYDDAIENIKNTIRDDPQGFIKVAASGALDEFKQATEQGYINYFAEGTANYIDHFSTSAKQLFTDTMKDYAEREKIDLANATDEEITHLRSLALYNALVVSEAIPASQILKTGVNVTGKVAKDVGVGVYNSGKGIKEFLDNNFPPSDGDLIPISSGISKNVNTGFNQKNLIENVNQIFVPVQGKKTKQVISGLILKDPDLSKISRRFGWGSKFSYKVAKREINRIYKEQIYPKALDAKGDIFNDIKLLQPEDQVLVNMMLNETWVKTGWMPGKNNILFTEIDDSGIKFNYPTNDMGELKDLKPYNTMLHKMYLHSFNPKQGDPVVQVQDLIQHKDLFTLFPELKTMPIKFTKTNTNMGIKGHYVPSGGKDSYNETVKNPAGMIELNIKNLVGIDRDLDIIENGNNLSNHITDQTQEIILSTLFHEMQHVIQGKNNYLSFGRSPETKSHFNLARARNAEEIVKKIDRFNFMSSQGFGSGTLLNKPLPDYYVQFYRNGEYDIVSDLHKLSPSEYPTLAGSNAPKPIKLSLKAAELLSKKLQYDLFEKVGASADDFMSPKMFAEKSELIKDPKKYFEDLRMGNVSHNIKNHFTYYNDLMETESRLVQARMKLPFDQRKKIPPYRPSADVAMEMMGGMGLKAVPFSASKPATAAARLTLFDLLMSGRNTNIAFDDLTPKGGISSSKIKDLETNINDVDNFIKQLETSILNSSLVKGMQKSTFKGGNIDKDLKTESLSKEIAQAIVFQDFHKIFFSGLSGDLSKIKPDPFIDGLNKIGLETIVPQIIDLQSRYLNSLAKNVDIAALTSSQKEIAKNMKSNSTLLKTRDDYSLKEKELLQRTMLMQDYTFNRPLEMGDIDASRVAAKFTLGTDKIPQYIQSPGQSITIENEYKF